MNHKSIDSTGGAVVGYSGDGWYTLRGKSIMVRDFDGVLLYRGVSYGWIALTIAEIFEIVRK